MVPSVPIAKPEGELNLAALPTASTKPDNDGPPPAKVVTPLVDNFRMQLLLASATKRLPALSIAISVGRSNSDFDSVLS
jgi:hypothetical protein